MSLIFGIRNSLAYSTYSVDSRDHESIDANILEKQGKKSIIKLLYLSYRKEPMCMKLLFGSTTVELLSYLVC